MARNLYLDSKYIKIASLVVAELRYGMEKLLVQTI